MKYGFLLLALLPACNPFDPTNSTQAAAEERILTGNPNPGVVAQHTRVTLIPSASGMNEVTLWLNRQILEPDPRNLAAACYMRADWDGQWECWFDETTLVEYQFKVGSLESKGTGPVRELGTYTIE